MTTYGFTGYYLQRKQCVWVVDWEKAVNMNSFYSFSWFNSFLKRGLSIHFLECVRLVPRIQHAKFKLNTLVSIWYSPSIVKYNSTSVTGGPISQTPQRKQPSMTLSLQQKQFISTGKEDC